MAVAMDEAVPKNLSYDDVSLAYEETVPGDPERGLVPFHHYRIIHCGTDVGHINFKVGDTEHIRLVAGHIGYEVREEFRGRGFAYMACRALAPFARSLYPSVLITVDPSNSPSIRVIERLGAAFLDELEVPEHDPAFQKGARRKRRYKWVP